jgi:hypothetical protein
VSVGGAAGSRLILDGCRFPLDDEHLTLRWWDDSDVAWEVVSAVERRDPPNGQLTVDIVDSWRPAVMRRAARVSIQRAPVELVTHGGDGRVVRRIQVSCHDVSATGCGVAGLGPKPSEGDIVQVGVTTPTLTARVDARVVRVSTAAFGGWHAGLEFLPHTASDHASLIAWRDSSAHPG